MNMKFKLTRLTILSVEIKSSAITTVAAIFSCHTNPTILTGKRTAWICDYKKEKEKSNFFPLGKFIKIEVVEGK